MLADAESWTSRRRSATLHAKGARGSSRPLVWLVYPYAQFYPARLRRFVEVVKEWAEQPR